MRQIYVNYRNVTLSYKNNQMSSVSRIRKQNLRETFLRLSFNNHLITYLIMLLPTGQLLYVKTGISYLFE